MRKTYRVLGYLIAAEVVVQAMAIAYAMAGLGYWIAEDGGVLDKQVLESDSLSFAGLGGFITHGINGTMVIPLLALLFLVVSFFAGLPGASRRAGAVVGLVAVQVALGITAHSLPFAAALHACNAFLILVVAFTAAHRARAEAPAALVEQRVGVDA